MITNTVHDGPFVGGGVSTKRQAIQCARGDLTTLSRLFLPEVLPCSAVL